MGKSRGGARCSGPGCARKMEENCLCSIKIQKRRLAAKVQPGEARFGPELDGEKLWRRQVFGARNKMGKSCGAPGVRSQDAREKWKKTVFVL